MSSLQLASMRVVAAWDATQVELHGRYSVDRMRALRNFENNTNLRKVLLVAILTPVPCLAAVTVADAIPLKPIELGLAHSQGFWIRCIFAITIYTVSTIEQFRYFIPAAPISTSTYLVVTVVVTALTTLGTYALSLLIGYPLPFAVAMLSVPWAISLVIALGISLRSHIKRHPSVVTEIVQFILIVSCQVSLVVIYPAYTFVFVQLTTFQQAAFAVLLPVIKLVEKNLMSFVLRNVDDLKPEIIIFNVEVFNALFVSFCMQGANSIGTNLVLLLVDFFMACATIRDLNVMLNRVNQLAEKMGLEMGDLVEAALAIAEQFPESEDSISFQIRSDRRSQRSSLTRLLSSPFLRNNQVVPFSNPPLDLLPNAPTLKELNSSMSPRQSSQSKKGIQLLSAKERRYFLHQTLQILHMTEYVLLIEYTEVLIPVVYSLYLTILFCLPNRVYYPQHKDLNVAKLRATIGNVMMNAVLEFLSLVALSIILRKKLKVSPLHQLAFVLQTQWRVVQSKLIQWMVVTVQSSLIHVGADYTFKFPWLRKH